jgi:hypothetical protein
MPRPIITSHYATLPKRHEQLTESPEVAEQIAENWLAELVTNKGYHSNETMVDLRNLGSAVTSLNRNVDGETGSASKQNVTPFTPIGGASEASAGRAYYVVAD